MMMMMTCESVSTVHIPSFRRRACPSDIGTCWAYAVFASCFFDNLAGWRRTGGLADCFAGSARAASWSTAAVALDGVLAGMMDYI